MKHQLLLAAAALAALSAGAQDYVQRDMLYNAGVSPDGAKVWGYNGPIEPYTLSSYIFDTASRQQKWATEYDEEVLDYNGQILDINSNGVAVGTMIDTDWIAAQMDIQTSGATDLVENQPMHSAFILKNGETIKLDHCGFDTPEDLSSLPNAKGSYPRTVDGFYAYRISDDARTIVGYIRYCTTFFPVVWRLNQSTGNYVGELCYMPARQSFYACAGVSRDCKTMVWNNKNSDGVSYIYTDGDFDSCKVFKVNGDTELVEDPFARAVSPNGKLVLFSCLREFEEAYGILNLDTEEITWVPRTHDMTSMRLAIAEKVNDDYTGFYTQYNYKPVYFDASKDFALYLEDYLKARGMTPTVVGSFGKARVTGVSEDGNIICGNSLTFNANEGTGDSFVISLPQDYLPIYLAPKVSAYSSSVDEVTAVWEPLKVRSDVEIVSYNVDCGSSVYSVAPDDAEHFDGEKYSYVFDAPIGSYYPVTLTVTLRANGNEFECVPSYTSTQTSALTELYFFDNLDNSNIVNNGLNYEYVGKEFTPAPSTADGVLNWRIDVYDFDNPTPLWNVLSICTHPYEAVLESRWFDASDEKDFYLTYHAKPYPLNTGVADDSNMMHAEYSLDGANWITLQTTKQLESDCKWTAYALDLKDLEGKIFKIRFRVEGDGSQAAEWRLDNIGILSNSEMIDAPEDLMVLRNEPGKPVKLTWKNPQGAYEASYMYNTPYIFTANVGGEPDADEIKGTPFIVAQDFTADMMKPYAGKYINTVSTLVYEPQDDAETPVTDHLTVEALVYDEDGTVISKGTLSPEGPWYDYTKERLVMPIQTIFLDTPVLVEAGRDYRVAIRVSDYPAGMAPVWYFSASDDFIPGVTDLFSEDDGLTWQSLYDVYDTDEDIKMYGRGIWNIRPGMTDQKDIEPAIYPQTHWYYHVYRDGELLPGLRYFSQQTATDENPGIGSHSYTVRAFTRDGKVSPLSKPLNVDYASVKDLVDNGDFAEFLYQDGVITLSGEYDSAVLYNLQGTAVAAVAKNTVALPAERGVYVLVIEKDGRKLSRKFMK